MRAGEPGPDGVGSERQRPDPDEPGTAEGEELNMVKHELLADVKAVTFHNFKVEETDGVWKAEVILDV